MPIITLTTDFGTADGYVGQMKAVIERASAKATLPWRVIDIAHEIPRGDVAHAAWVIATTCPGYPDDSVHVVVVDPGVGGARRGVVASHANAFYVGPDNGVFAYLEPSWVRAIESPRLMAESVSPTFHGRDVFAHVAAALAAGLDVPAEIGARVQLAGALPWGPRPAGEGRVVHIDHFGNLVSDLPRGEAGAAVAIGGRRLAIGRTYEDVAPGEVLAYVGSAGTIEIAARDGRADRVLDAPRGTRVVPVAAGSEYR